MKKLFFILFFASISFASFSQTVATADTTLSVSVVQKDADVTSISYTWTKVSGPTQGTILTPNQATTVVSGLVAGSYVIQCVAKDNFGTTSNTSVWNITVVRVGGKLVISAGADITIQAKVK